MGDRVGYWPPGGEEEVPAFLDPKGSKEEKLAGIRTVSTKVDVVDPEWKGKAIALVLAALQERGQVIADEITPLFPVPEPCHPSTWSAVFAHMSRLGMIHCVDYKYSRKKTSHQALLRVWAAGPAPDGEWMP